MKILLTFVVLLFSSSVLAGVGDVYYCEINKFVDIKKNDVAEYTSEKFKFIRKENLIEFGEGGYFDNNSMNIEDPELYKGEFFFGSGSRWERFVYNNGDFVFAFTMNSGENTYITAVVATCDIF